MYLKRNPSMAETFGGCTGVIVVKTPEFIVCANAGDSRAIMSKIHNPTAIRLSYDHKPTNFEETERIKAAGGNVENKRVNGNLAVSRGFGDFEFKENKNKGPEGQMVSCVPQIITRILSHHDEFIVIACDGLWDVCSNEQAIGFVREICDKGTNTMQLVAEKMCDKALELGSNDNISVIVVKLSNSINPIHESTPAATPKVRPPSAQDLLSGKISPRPVNFNHNENSTRPDYLKDEGISSPEPAGGKSSPDLTTKPRPPSAVKHWEKISSPEPAGGKSSP
jgi:serine/threonine protein phosphatase PrpC